ncbi:odorant receptor 49b-like [Aethina tumida]|uniref:odorant receptor 49b-like n=1 Tax=Aethina tumida TaxID=116153 RepID=UPI00096B2064|nr:odorant receptor 49b-like [Aethina tumida]
MYILFRLKSIQYFLRNSEKLSNVLKEKYKISLDDARYCVIKSIIKEHSLVIDLIINVKDGCSTFILLDFLLSSLQLGATLLKIYPGFEDETIWDKVTALCIVIIINRTMWLLYYYGSELTYEGRNISIIAYTETAWYDYDKKSKDALLLLMLRSQKDLSLKIGPFAIVGLEAFVQICKATFSYFTFMRSF